jgi:enamine deaminase RidA (YjgF/YER057c/UK114 family)
MTGRIEARLAKLGIELPEAQPPWADYVSYVVADSTVYLSGQLPKLGDESYLGKCGADLTVEQGCRAARISAINMLPHLKEACGGDLDRVIRCIEIGGFVQCTTDFFEPPLVLNGASELIVAVFGEEIGRHTRFAVGVASLPFNYAVEIKAIFQID